MKKKILLILMFIVAVTFMPRVYAAITLGSVTDITNPDTLKTSKGTLTHSTDNSTTTITYDSATFRILDGSVEGRTAGYAWIGIKVTKPDDAKKYTITFNGESDSETTANGDIEDYIGFNADELKSAVDDARNLEFTYEIEWKDDNGNTATQKITIVIVPSNITLQSQNYDSDHKEEWNNTTYKEEVEKVMTEIYSDLEEAINQAKSIDTSKYTEESVKVLEDAIAEAEAADKDVTTNNQTEIKALKQALEDAIDSLEDKPIEIGDVSNISAENPKTGDTIIACAFVALLLIAVIIVLSVKKSLHRI